MREPFSSILPSDERLVAAAECELGVTTGPLAGPAEMLALFSPLISIILLIRLDGWQAKLIGALLPPLLMALLARYPLRRWHRPRQWIGVTDRSVLVWRRPAALRPEPRVTQDIPLRNIEGVELEQDSWDRRAGTQQVILHLPGRTIHLDRTRGAERIRDAILAACAALPPAPTSAPGPAPADFLPPAPQPGDYRP
jgi:hypothetical protein